VVNLRTKFEMCMFNCSIDVVGVTKSTKSLSRDVGHAFFDLYFCMFWFVGLVINPTPQIQWRFKNYKIRSHDVGHAPLTYFCIFWFVDQAANPHTKFKVSNFSHFRDT